MSKEGVTYKRITPTDRKGDAVAWGLGMVGGTYGLLEAGIDIGLELGESLVAKGREALRKLHVGQEAGAKAITLATVDRQVSNVIPLPSRPAALPPEVVLLVPRDEPPVQAA